MNDEKFHAQIKELYHPPKNQFTLIEVPDIRYMVIDGRGDPKHNGIEASMMWLWSIVYFLIPIAKKRLGKNFAYPPLECLFWANNTKDFISGNKDKWYWRVMVVLGNWVTREIFDTAVERTEEKKGENFPQTLQIKHLHESKCVQYMHIGDYGEVGNICEELYKEFLPKSGLEPNGYYHEIYLNDPNRTAPINRKTIIRQPVK